MKGALASEKNNEGGVQGNESIETGGTTEVEERDLEWIRGMVERN